MVGARAGLEDQAPPLAPQIPVEHALGHEPRFEIGLVGRERRAAVAAVVPWEVVDLAARRGIDPGPVTEQVVGPRNRTRGVRVRDDGPHGRRAIVVGFDQRPGPAGLGVAVVLGEDDEGRAGGPDSGRVPDRSGALARFDLDDPVPRESGQRLVAGLDRRSLRDDEHELDPVGDRLRGQVSNGGPHRRPALGGDDDRGQDRIAQGTSRVGVWSRYMQRSRSIPARAPPTNPRANPVSLSTGAS